MHKIIKAVSSSNPDSFYNVTFTHENNLLKVRCDCPAGRFGGFCKHKWRLINEDYEMLFDESQDADLQEVVELAQECEIYKLKSNLSKLHQQVADLEIQIKAEKKNIAQKLKNGF